MTVEVAEGFDAERWRGLAPDSPYHDPGWLAAMNSRLPGAVYTILDRRGIGFIGVLVDDPDCYEAYNPQAILWRDRPVFELTDPAGRAAELADRAAELGRNRKPNSLPALVLVAPGYHGDPAGPAADDPAALAGCLADLLDWCRRAGLAGLHLLFTGSPALTQAVAGLGGLSYPLTTRWTLPVWWQDWPGYLAGLDAKRARELRREHRLATSTLQLVELDPAEHADELVAGRCAVLRRHGQAADPAAEHRRLAMLVERFGDRLTVFGGVAEGRLVTGCLCRWHGRELQVLYSAVTEAGRAHRFAHFAGTYYAVIEGVSTVSCDAIDYGISHRAGKRARGCTVRRLFGQVLPTDPADRPSLAVATGLLDRYAESSIDR
jgi:hypothetical protein